MRQNKTPNEVAQKYGFTYAPIRVKMREKKRVRFNRNKLEDAKSISIIIELVSFVLGSLFAAIFLLWAYFSIFIKPFL